MESQFLNNNPVNNHQFNKFHSNHKNNTNPYTDGFRITPHINSNYNNKSNNNLINLTRKSHCFPLHLQKTADNSNMFNCSQQQYNIQQEQSLQEIQQKQKSNNNQCQQYEKLSQKYQSKQMKIIHNNNRRDLFRKIVKKIQERSESFYKYGFKSYQKKQHQGIFLDVFNLTQNKLKGTLTIGQLWSNKDSIYFLKENNMFLNKKNLVEQLKILKQEIKRQQQTKKNIQQAKKQFKQKQEKTQRTKRQKNLSRINQINSKHSDQNTNTNNNPLSFIQDQKLNNSKVKFKTLHINKRNNQLSNQRNQTTFSTHNNNKNKNTKRKGTILSSLLISNKNIFSANSLASSYQLIDCVNEQYNSKLSKDQNNNMRSMRSMKSSKTFMSCTQKMINLQKQKERQNKFYKQFKQIATNLKLLRDQKTKNENIMQSLEKNQLRYQRIKQRFADKMFIIT